MNGTRHSNALRTHPALARRRRQQRRSLALSLLFGVLAMLFDAACDAAKRRGLKRREALCDGAAHIATALAVSLPATPYVAGPRRFVGVAALSAVLIDLDHVVAARSARLIRCMTMPARPPSHSLVTIGAVTYAAERMWPGTQSALAVMLGLGSHLLRDLATGGAPLFIPRRIVAVPRSGVVAAMAALGMFGRWYLRWTLDPARPRRSNPAALAPESLLVAARAVRTVREAARAA